MEHVAKIHGGNANKLHSDLLWLFHDAQARCSVPYVKLRRMMEYSLDIILKRYSGSNDVNLERIVNRISEASRNLFVFCEHVGIDATNNAAERVLRDVVVCRKISSQIKGGLASMVRMSNFLTCVLIWHAQGKSVLEEVLGAV